MTKVFSLLCLVWLGICGSKASANTYYSPKDSMLVRLGKAGTIILVLDNKSKLAELQNYDFNALIRKLDTLYNKTSQGMFRPDTVLIRKKTIIKIKKNGISKDSVVEKEVKIVSERPFDKDTLVYIRNFGPGKQAIQLQINRGRIAIQEYGFVAQSESNNKQDSLNKLSKRKLKLSTRTNSSFDIGLGLNNWLENGQFPDADGKNYGLKPLSSRYVALRWNNRTRIGGPKSPLGVTYGLEVAWNNFMFEENVRIIKSGSMVVFEDAPAGLSYQKSKLTVCYLNIPLMINFTFGDWNLGAGGFGGYRLGSHSKQKYTLNSDTKKDKDFDNFYINNWQYGLRFEAGYKWVDLFFNLNLNPVFNTSRAPDLRAFSFGILL